MYNIIERIEEISPQDFKAIKDGGEIWVENSDWSPAAPDSLEREDFRIGFVACTFDEAFEGLGYWYAMSEYPQEMIENLYSYLDWADMGKDVEVALGLRCIEWEDGYYFFALEIDDG